jgi:hypothetical protein
MEGEIMDEKKIIIEGYQPTVKAQDGYQPVSVPKDKSQSIPVPTPAAMVKVIPPKGGTGEIALKK